LRTDPERIIEGNLWQPWLTNGKVYNRIKRKICTRYHCINIEKKRNFDTIFSIFEEIEVGDRKKAGISKVNVPPKVRLAMSEDFFSNECVDGTSDWDVDVNKRITTAQLNGYKLMSEVPPFSRIKRLASMVYMYAFSGTRHPLTAFFITEEVASGSFSLELPKGLKIYDYVVEENDFIVDLEENRLVVYNPIPLQTIILRELVIDKIEKIILELCSTSKHEEINELVTLPLINLIASIIITHNS